ncbi:hypothetical protein ACX1N5_11705 [Acinetobacter sp. ANC 4636]
MRLLLVLFMDCLGVKYMNAQAYIPQRLSPEQIFEALAKHIKIEFAEVDTNDWSILDSHSNVCVCDFYTGFLKFRFSSSSFEDMDNRDRKLRAKTFFCEYLGLDGENNERYRVGTDKPSIYVLKRVVGANANTALKDFEFFKESNGSLSPVSLSEKLIGYISKARSAEQRAEYNKVLEKTGLFQSPDYKKFKRQQRGLSVR